MCKLWEGFIQFVSDSSEFTYRENQQKGFM